MNITNPMPVKNPRILIIQLEMSRCGINRYKAGGRCGSFEPSGSKQDTTHLGASFASMMAAREAQDAALKSPVPVKQYATPALTQVASGQSLTQVASGQALPLVASSKAPTTKQKDIDLILQSDWE